MSGALRPSSTTEDGRLRHYVDAEHRARHESHRRTEARLAEMRALPRGGRFDLYERLREEYRALRGVSADACVRRS